MEKDFVSCCARVTVGRRSIHGWSERESGRCPIIGSPPPEKFSARTERILTGNLSTGETFLWGRSYNAETFVLGRRYFNKREAYQFRDYLFQTDFSWVRHFNVTPAHRYTTTRSHCSSSSITSPWIYTYMYQRSIPPLAALPRTSLQPATPLHCCTDCHNEMSQDASTAAAAAAAECDVPCDERTVSQRPHDHMQRIGMSCGGSAVARILSRFRLVVCV